MSGSAKRGGKAGGRRRCAALPVALCLCVAGLLPAAGAAEAFARTKLAAKGDIWVGQRVAVEVELLSPGFFSGSAAFDLPRVPGVIVCPPEDRPVLGSETIGAVRYTVQRHELAVFAQRAGRVEIPPYAVRFASRQEGSSAPVEQSVRTDAVTFEAQLPPGAEGLSPLISSLDLQAVETWQPEPGSAKVGDAFTRTIRFSAPDIPAMVFPPIPAARAEGLGVYPKAPQVRDYSNRGERRGERTETVAYVCERPGRVRIPAMRLRWWDLDRRQLRVVAFLPRTFDVAPNPACAGAPAAAARDWRKTLRAAGGLGAGGVMLACVAWRTRKRWRGWGQAALAYWSPLHLAPLNPPPIQPSGLNAEAGARRCRDGGL